MTHYNPDSTTIQALERWQYRYHRLGLATIPLGGPDGKQPLPGTSWQHVAPTDQWRLAAEAAGGSWAGNIGLLAGNGYGFIDCDGPATVEAVNAMLGDLAGPTRDGRPAKYAAYADRKAPRVTTPHDGQHVYIRVKNVPDGFNWARLPGDVGTGELRLQNCYVAAPSSKGDNGRRYAFQRGRQLEALTQLPAIDFRDLASMGLLRDTDGSGAVVAVPVMARDLPPYAYQLLYVLGVAGRGRPINHYATRSEAEAAVIALAIVNGWGLGRIERLFEQYQPGHYAEKNARGREAYLALTYNKVMAYLATTPERSHLGQLYAAAEAATWPGRGGGTDKRVYMGLLGLAWPSGATLLAAASRDLAQLAGVSARNVPRVTRRLHTGGTVQYVGKSYDNDGWRPDRANRYRITGLAPAAADRDGPAPATNETVTVGGREVWAWSKLGASCELVYSHLPLDTTASIRDLAQLTGKHRNTITRALDTLAQHGLAEHNGKDGRGRKWGRGAVSIAHVARKLGAERASRNRRRQTEAEREAYHAMLGTRDGQPTDTRETAA